MNRAWAPLTILVLACVPHPSTDLPSAMTLTKTDWSPVTEFLDSVVAAGAAPGAVLGVSVAGDRFVYATGTLGSNEAARPTSTTVYDLASLTKVIGLTTAAMLAVEEARLDLDAPVQRYVPTFVGEGKERVTIRMLLAHASGLPAWRPLYREVTTRSEAYALVGNTPLGSTPSSIALYSDLGAILLTQVVETVYQERIDSLLERRVFQPLGLRSVQYLPPASHRDCIAPTELDPRRGRVLRGEVHDENAALMDGVSGHAGLFGSVDDVLTFAEWMVEGWNERSLVRAFTRAQQLVPGSSRALGWDTPSPGSSAGSRLSSRSFGHTGFTGTSLWIDPDSRLAIVLLSNRVNPTRENLRWTPVRAKLADLVMTTLLEDVR